MPTLLWWGRSDPQYSRNQLLLKILSDLGWHVFFFHPLASPLGKAQAFFQQLKSPDLIWVPCFRQRDMPSAVFWARRWRCPIVFDPLISAYQKEIYERCKWSAHGKKARRLLKWEAELFRQADIVIADTYLHARFYADTFQIDARKIHIVHVGADEKLFQPTDVQVDRLPMEVLFYGSFLALQGPDVIVDAAAIIDDKTIQWVLLGEGDLKTTLMKKAQGMSNVIFEPWIQYEKLPQRLARAHILLGIFGTTPKATMVIPNKVFQSMAVGRPLITRVSKAYPEAIANSSTVGWVSPGDSRAIADCVQRWASNPRALIEKGRLTRRLFERWKWYRYDRKNSKREISSVNHTGLCEMFVFKC